MKKLHGFSLLSFIAALAGIVISFLLLKEDILSTAKTVFEYFPARYGVIPSATWEGAIVLGLFTSVLQVVSASVMFSDRFSNGVRWLAAASFATSCYFDNWTDIIFRSGNLTGDVTIATITTLAFYTFGSEITQGLSWLVATALWRPAISDLLMAIAKTVAGFKSIGSEWGRFQHAAMNQENKERYGNGNEQKKPSTPVTPWQPPNGGGSKPVSPVFDQRFTNKFKKG
jgi:hypothetical protein